MTGSLQIKKDRYYAVIRMDDGKQKWISLKISSAGNNKRAAQKKMRDLLIELERQKENEQIVTSDILFVDWIKEWMQQKKCGVRANTYECYCMYLDKHIYPFFEPLKLTLGTLTAQHLQRYYNTKLEEGQSVCTLKKHNAIIHGSLQEAFRKDIILFNPAEKVTLPKKKKFYGSAYSPEEAKMLLSVVNDDDPFKPALILALLYGLRRSEILGLRWSDIDFVSGTISICNTVTRMATVHECNETKNEASRRTLAMVPGTDNYFMNLLTSRVQTLPLSGATFSMNDHVCVWPDGKPLSPDYLSQHFQRVLEKYGLRKIRFHDLRHTTGSLLLEAGVDIKTIQEFLGHSQASTTVNIYLHSVKKGSALAANHLQALMP